MLEQKKKKKIDLHVGSFCDSLCQKKLPAWHPELGVPQHASISRKKVQHAWNNVHISPAWKINHDSFINMHTAAGKLSPAWRLDFTFWYTWKGCNHLVPAYQFKVPYCVIPACVIYMMRNFQLNLKKNLKKFFWKKNLWNFFLDAGNFAPYKICMLEVPPYEYR